MDKYNIHNMLEDISQSASTELSKGIDQVNTKEMGEVVDMIKDLSEAEKNKMEACYYQKVIEAMDNAEYGEDYDWEGRIRKGYSQNRRMGYEPRVIYDEEYGMMPSRMGYSNGAYGGGRRGQSSNQEMSGMSGSRNSRYGYSHDEYMTGRKMHKTNTPEDVKKRTDMLEDHMDDLYDMFKEEVSDMTPEEKQLWKAKLGKIINM